MNWADFAILGVLLLSAIIGFFRGFLRESVGLATWVLAFYLAFTACEAVSVWFKPWIDAESIRVAAGFAVIFIVILILGAIVNYILGQLVNKTGFAGTDRTLGGVFGVLRGVAILVLLTLLAGATPLPDDDWWQESVFMAHLQDGAIQVRSWLPDQFADAIVYPDEIQSTTRPAQTTAMPVRPQALSGDTSTAR